jgi:uncharacterized membrane protein
MRGGGRDRTDYVVRNYEIILRIWKHPLKLTFCLGFHDLFILFALTYCTSFPDHMPTHFSYMYVLNITPQHNYNKITLYLLSLFVILVDRDLTFIIHMYCSTVHCGHLGSEIGTVHLI